MHAKHMREEHRDVNVVMAESTESCQEDNVGEELVPKKNSSSVIWKYFGYKREDTLQAQVLCKSCQKVVATSKGNTTNLHSHLQHNHLDLYKELQGSASKSKTTDVRPTSSRSSKAVQQQSSIHQSFASVTPYEKSSKRHKEVTEAISRYIAKDMMSINTVSRTGFVSLINILDRRYQMPSRTYFSQVAIPQMYDTCRGRVHSELSEVVHFASTTDLWSSRTTEPYLSFTVHFITDNFELKSRCLETVYFPDSHTGENIALGLREVLVNWDLHEDRQVCITTDNGSNVVKATELNNWVRLQCFGHRLHLAIGKC